MATIQPRHLAMDDRSAMRELPGVGPRTLAATRRAAPMVVVSRHAGLVDYLREIGLIDAATPVLTHATAEDVLGKHVVGVVPLHLAAAAALVTEVPLDLPFKLRGMELSADQVRLHARPPVTYRVTVELQAVAD